MYKEVYDIHESFAFKKAQKRNAVKKQKRQL